MTRTVRIPYRDQRLRHAEPKPRGGPGIDEQARPNGIPLYECKSTKYQPYQAMRISTAIGDSGVADERVCWRCPDCGVEASDVTADCCFRCGSCEALEYR